MRLVEGRGIRDRFEGIVSEGTGEVGELESDADIFREGFET